MTGGRCRFGQDSPFSRTGSSSCFRRRDNSIPQLIHRNSAIPPQRREKQLKALKSCSRRTGASVAALQRLVLSVTLLEALLLSTADTGLFCTVSGKETMWVSVSGYSSSFSGLPAGSAAPRQPHSASHSPTRRTARVHYIIEALR